ncbi:hypothetical protein, partial [Brevundimonas sp. FT23028]|uniref:hypothetical protein n=1 Tax=Brevundimonas sp. FT23028 TaxID=3393748 RepID=UPI003B58A225
PMQATLAYTLGLPQASAAVTARVEAAGEALKTVMADLEPRAAAIRTDASLSAEDKSARIQALLTPHQPVLDEFTAAIRDLVSFQAAAEGASPDEIAGAMSMIGPMIIAQITQALVTGETDDGA